VQQLVKTKALETSSIPTKENFADLGTKKLSADRMRYLMHGVGVYDESAGELVGPDVVTRERAADDVRGVLCVKALVKEVVTKPWLQRSVLCRPCCC